MNKVALFVFNGDPMCFVHVLLNALDMKEKGYAVEIVVEGAATRLVPDLGRKENPLNGLWEKVKSTGLVAGACKACSQKLGTHQASVDQNLALLDDMKGHPGMAHYIEKGYRVITF